MTTQSYMRLDSGPIDQIDAAVWNSDMFHNRENLAAFRSILARWERGLKEAEEILTESEKENAETCEG